MDKKKLIMVMGVQRSGTTALFNSLAGDQSLTAVNESVDNAIYYKYRLRPVELIAPILDRAPGAVLLKPLSESFHRSLEMVRLEFARYDVRFVWIYRDPVNVIFSMHQKGWVRQSDFGHAVHIEEWIRRNHLALTFQQANPAEIALVRYEDCSADPGVFRALCEWLGVDGKPLFRPDRGQGRCHISARAQQKIDAAAAPILGALDAARTFRAHAFRRWRQTLATSVTGPSAKWGAARRQRGISDVEPNWNSDGAHVAAAIPSSIDDLYCWIDAGRKPRREDRLDEFVESGPHQFAAGIDSLPPFHLPYLNGKFAFYFAHEKSALRQKGPPGMVSFGEAGDWSFLFDGTPFSIFALFRPTFPKRAICAQERGVVVSAGNSALAPNLTVLWNRNLEATQMTLRRAGSTLPIVATAPAGSHPNRRWRVFHCQFGGEDDSQISISSNGIAGAPVSFPGPLEGGSSIENLPLQLGGSGEPGTFFYGGFAELIVFRRALTVGERFSLLHYLREKYGL